MTAATAAKDTTRPTPEPRNGVDTPVLLATINALAGQLELAKFRFRATIIWATGYRRDYRWLEVPVTDEAGEIRHEGGVTPAPGLYVLGLQFLRRRKSSFIDGVGGDATELADHLVQHLSCRRRLAA